MTMTDSHLADEALHEYLDQALDEPARAAAAAHLAGCALCAERLSNLEALFAGLEALPDAPLPRDLRQGVMAGIHARATTPMRPIADPLQPAFRLVFLVQLCLALALLAAGLPILFSRFNPAALVTGSLGAAGLDLAGLWAMIEGWPQAALGGWPSIALLPPAIAGLVLVAAGVFWLVGNALLLRPSSPARRRP